MRHRLGFRKLNKNSSQRKALLRGLAVELIMNGRILVSIERAKELRRVVEPLLARAKTDTLASRRLVASRLVRPEAVKKLFSVWGPATSSRSGGYTRIIRLGFRPGDHARRALIEMVDAPAPVAAAESPTPA